ncbi:hypothetical protein BN1723_019732, partial [Verticillium longisporum]
PRFRQGALPLGHHAQGRARDARGLGQGHRPGVWRRRAGHCARVHGRREQHRRGHLGVQVWRQGLHHWCRQERDQHSLYARERQGD